MKKSRYQITNRGRKGKPAWYLEDFDGITGIVGKYIDSSSVKCHIEGRLKQLREQERSMSSE